MTLYSIISLDKDFTAGLSFCFNEICHRLHLANVVKLALFLSVCIATTLLRAPPRWNRSSQSFRLPRGESSSSSSGVSSLPVLLLLLLLLLLLFVSFRSFSSSRLILFILFVLFIFAAGGGQRRPDARNSLLLLL